MFAVQIPSRTASLSRKLGAMNPEDAPHQAPESEALAAEETLRSERDGAGCLVGLGSLVFMAVIAGICAWMLTRRRAAGTAETATSASARGTLPAWR